MLGCLANLWTHSVWHELFIMAQPWGGRPGTRLLLHMHGHVADQGAGRGATSSMLFRAGTGCLVCVQVLHVYTAPISAPGSSAHLLKRLKDSNRM